MIPQTLSVTPNLDRWVRFPENGKVQICFGKMEYGQGAATALAQIGAEELDVSWPQVVIAEPSTPDAPDEGLTVGSMSVEMSGASVRQACAEVRALFLAHAAKLLGRETSALGVAEGAILSDGKPTGHTYWTLAKDVDLACAATGEPAPKNPKDYRLVGRNIPRHDLAPKIFGAAFIHDHLPKDVVHARVLRQPGTEATLVSFDEAAIRKAAGAAIEIFRETSFVALLSDSEEAVERAVEAATRTAKWDQPRALAAELADPQSLRTLPSEAFESGAPKAGPSNRKRIEATYAKPYLTHGSMGPSCAVAQWRDGALTLYTHAQGVYPIRAMIAGTLGLEPEQIVVHHMQGPGNYGHNGSDDAAFDACLIAHRHPGRTIRVQWRREDEIGHAPLGTAMTMTLSAELDDSGRIADYTAEIWSGPHVGRGRALGERALPRKERAAPAATPPVIMRGGFRFSGGLLNALPSYDIEAVRTIEHVARVPVRTSSFRGLGGPPNEFAGECFVDELAQEAGQDPLAYRLSMLSEPRARHVLARAASLSNWSARGAGGGGEGIGLAFCIHRNRGAFVSCVAKVFVDKDVRVEKVWCVADAGLIVNPDGARNQIEGGIVMAASWALKEEIHFDGAGVAQKSWSDYPILRFDEVPDVEIELVDAPDKPAMGIGEISSGPAMAAIGNAIAHALGVRVRTMPFTRERIAQAMLG